MSLRGQIEHRMKKNKGNDGFNFKKTTKKIKVSSLNIVQNVILLLKQDQ